MCLQCVRADRRQAEGRPARWQRPRARLLMLPEGVDPAAGPTAADLARAVDITRWIKPGSLTFTSDRIAKAGRTIRTGAESPYARNPLRGRGA